MLTRTAVKQIGQNVRALVQEGRIAVALAALFQQRDVENNPPLVGLGGAG